MPPKYLPVVFVKVDSSDGEEPPEEKGPPVIRVRPHRRQPPITQWRRLFLKLHRIRKLQRLWGILGTWLRLSFPQQIRGQLKKLP